MKSKKYLSLHFKSVDPKLTHQKVKAKVNVIHMNQAV